MKNLREQGKALSVVLRANERHKGIAPSDDVVAFCRQVGCKNLIDGFCRIMDGSQQKDDRNFLAKLLDIDYISGSENDLEPCGFSSEEIRAYMRKNFGSKD